MTTNGITALVLTSPQNDFLSETAVAWGLGGRNVQENGHGRQHRTAAAQREGRRDACLRVPALLLPVRPPLAVRAHSHDRRGTECRRGSRTTR